MQETSKTTIQLEYDGKTHTLTPPTSFNEAEPSLLFFIINQKVLQPTQSRDLRACAVHAFLAQFSTDRAWHKLRMQLKYADLAMMMPHFDWVNAESPAMTINKLPYISGKLAKKYYGPSHKFKFLSIYEFALADGHFINYCHTQNIDELFKLAAIIYRPAKSFFKQTLEKLEIHDFTEDPRQILKETDIQKRIKIFQKTVTPTEVYLIFLYFQGCREFLTLQFPELFKDQEQKSNESSGGWGEIILELSGGKFGTLKETAKEPVYNMMMEMNALSKKAEAQRKAYEAKS